MKKLWLILLCFFIIGNNLIEKETQYHSVKEEETIFVTITGAVLIPGTYQLKKDSQLIEAINYAGGILPEADITKLNLGQTITKGSYHIEKFKNENEKKEVLYNLNYITYNELITLDSITDNRALEIILYRKQSPFYEVEELLNIKGIGQKTYEKIKDYFYI